MRNQCSDQECRPEDEKRRGVRSNNQPTRPKELPLKNHSKITFVKKNDRARTQLDRSYLEIAHEHLTGTVTKPRKLHHEEFTRSFHTSFDIHQQTTYSMKNDQVRNYFEGPDFKLVRKATPGAENRREACSTLSSTRAFSLGYSFHQKMPYLESYDRRKESHDRAKSGVGTYAHMANTDRFESSKTPNQLRNNAWMFYSIPKKTTCCLRDAKTTANQFSRAKQEEDPHLPYLEPKRIIQQQLFSPSYLHVFKTLSMNLDVPRSHQFAPKLSRLKTSRTCLIWSDFVI